MPHLNNPNKKQPLQKANTGNYSLNAVGNVTVNATKIATTAVPMTAAGGGITTGGITFTGTTGTTVYGGGGSYMKSSPGPKPAPPNWKTYRLKPTTMNFGDSEMHESPANGREVYIASMSLSNGQARHHFDLFKKLHPEVEYLLCGIVEEEAHSAVTSVTNVIFPHPADAAIFEEWLDGYLDLFEGDREALYSYTLPQPPTRMNYSIQVPMGEHENQVELSLWIMQNCQDRVYYLSGILFFMNDEDAALYKLKFSAKKKA
jgi:hypothetical protein